MGQRLPRLPDSKGADDNDWLTLSRRKVEDQLKEMELEPEDIVDMLFAARVDLLHHLGARVPFAEAIGWERVVYYTSNHKGTPAQLKTMLKSTVADMKNVIKRHVLLNDNSRPDEYFTRVAMGCSEAYTRCFFSGISCRQVEFAQLVPGVDHPSNFIPVAPSLSSVSIAHITSEPQDAVLEVKRGGSCIVEEFGVDLIRKLAGLVPGDILSDVIKTSMDGTGTLCPRSAIRGWIARAVLTLMDMYGRGSLPVGFISELELCTWVEEPLSLQEVLHNVLSYTLSSDLSPFMLISPQERSIYAHMVLERDVVKIPAVLQMKRTKKPQVLCLIECYLVDTDGTTSFIPKGDTHSREIQKAITEFEQQWFDLKQVKGSSPGDLP